MAVQGSIPLSSLNHESANDETSRALKEAHGLVDSLPGHSAKLAQLLNLFTHDRLGHTDIVRCLACFAAQDWIQFTRSVAAVLNSPGKDERVSPHLLQGLLAAYTGVVTDAASMNNVMKLCKVPVDIGMALVTIVNPPDTKAVAVAATVLESKFSFPHKLPPTVTEFLVAAIHGCCDERSVRALEASLGVDAKVLMGAVNLLACLNRKVSLSNPENPRLPSSLLPQGTGTQTIQRHPPNSLLEKPGVPELLKSLGVYHLMKGNNLLSLLYGDRKVLEAFITEQELCETTSNIGRLLTANSKRLELPLPPFEMT